MVKNRAQLIILNGTSCVGKSSAAVYLRDNTKAEFEHIEWDSFLEKLPADRKPTEEERKDLVGLFTRHACEKLANGHSLILDIVCVPAGTFERLMNDFDAFDPLTVRIQATPATLTERELEREGKGYLGQAQEQHFKMHDTEQHPEYDLELDSTNLSVTDIGQTIIRHLNEGQQGQQQSCTP